MSEQVTYTGKLKKLKLIGTLEQKLESVLRSVYGEDEHCVLDHDTWEEKFRDEVYDRDETFILYKGDVYKVTEEERYDYGDVFVVNPTNKEDEYSFHVSYYNGGCGYEEAIEYALEENIK